MYILSIHKYVDKNEVPKNTKMKIVFSLFNKIENLAADVFSPDFLDFFGVRYVC